MSPITYSGASCSRAASRQRGSVSGFCRPTISSTTTECCATEKAWSPVVWPFQRATRARPWAMSSISMSSGEGSRRSSRRPESIRCQARPPGCERGNRFDAGRPTRETEGAAMVSDRSWLGAVLLHRLVAMAADEVIVDDADRLHEGIDDGRSAEFKTALGKFLGYRARDRGLRRHLLCAAVMVDLRPPVDEVP